MLDALESERYLALLERLEHAVESPRLVATDETVEDIAAREFKKLRKAARRAGTDATDEELHALRIRGKRARYAAELAETVVGKRATEFIREAKAFQDVLGDHQDAVVAETKIRELVRGRGGTVLAFSAGRLVEREERRREHARASWPEAWKRLREAWQEGVVVTAGHVRAAGGIVTRTSGGTTEVVLVHRPAYDDWTLPKGKALAGERDEECALREVEEETGLRCELGGSIDELEYLDNRGRRKTVKYFAMRPLGGPLQGQGEVDEARWVALDDALDELTYEHDRELLRGFARLER